MSENHQHTACIIGGGMSGLFTGALLAKNGYKVTVLEKNHIIGGGLQSFRRGDVVFNTGMQACAGYISGMISYQVCKYLGVSNEIKLLATDSQKQEIIWLNNNKSICLPKGRDAYQTYLVQLFPHEENGIKELLDCVFRVGHTFDYLFLQPIQRYEENVPYAYMSADELVRKYIHDDNLVAILEYVGWTTGHCLKAMPALEFCMMLTLYILGSHRFVNGAKQLADALCNVIEQKGGIVENDTEICEVNGEDGNIDYVVATDGRRWESEIFVWACTPKILLTVCREQVFRKSMTQRIQEYINPFSVFVVFCHLKKEKFKFINSSVYIPKSSKHPNLPQSIVFVTTPRSESDQWAESMEIYIPANYEDLAPWIATHVGERGDEYEIFKERIALEAINTISVYYPELSDAILNINVASGLTIRDYYGNPNGSCYGQQGLYIPIKTKLKNLYMTGQAVQNQGLAGIATTSVLTSEIILGRTLIEEIAQA